MSHQPARRPLLTALAATALLMTSTACGAVSGGSVDAASGSASGSSSASASLRPVKTITYVNPAPFYPAFTDVGDCLTKQADTYGWKTNEVGTPGSAVDNQGAIDLISQAIANGTDALVVFPTIPELFTPVIQEARAKGIYVVAQNAGAPSTGQQTQVGTDAKQLGGIIAEGLGAKQPDAQVGVLSGSASTTPHVDEIKGFQDAAASKFPGIKVVAGDYTNGDATKAPELWSNMLTAHPEITTLFAVQGTDVAAAITAVKERGLTGKVTVVANDLTPDHRAAIEDGSLLGVGEQGWCEAGTKAAEAVKSLSEGQQLPEFIPTTSTYYDKSNLPAQ
ncbi:sugar ABC transporter substrate-binding protein [Quadrisphaera oryzae]|uniref:sugar ABC transporter substrate-binding protein n=1 Tax=Quadrisphaera TaxID=317661 RepID=UPI001648DD5F|nr:sugar ABC transporter substrate-binding protein [Quadrisphaera sp. RL12-1S]MBC3760199.1 sugar ABC transporter substrate-binding protein [Quadrisphaera sp. RL12-1S]